jgi:hypothetical protein
MTGFLVAGAMAGLVSLGWPLYLHLRRRSKPVVQVIPSLRLFGEAKKLKRFPLLERILLLIARALFLIFLIAMLAQPFIETTDKLDLQRIDEQRADCRVGLLLDDSLTSLHGPSAGADAGTRLEASARWLTAQVHTLPKRARITIVLTSFPHPTRPMSKLRAVEFLGRVKSIPRSGDAVMGLRRLRDGLRGKMGAIIVAAPRDAALWEDLGEGTDLEESTGIYFLDMTDRRLPWYIESVVPATKGGENGWVCDLVGDPGAIADGELVGTDKNGREWRYQIPPSDARRGRANLLLPSGPPPYWYSLHGRPARASLGATATPGGTVGLSHPWLSWHFRAESLSAGEKLDGVAIVRLRTREGLVADKIVTVAIQSVYPETVIQHIDPLKPPDELRGAGAVVCVGGIPSGARISAWLRNCLERGARVMCLPTEGKISHEGTGGLLPLWGESMLVAPEKVLPLKIVARPSDTGYGIDEFLVSGLGSVRYARLREPRFIQRGKVLVATRNGRPFLVARRFGESGHVLALAAPISLASGSIAYHPTFPLLLRRVLFERTEITQTALGDIEVGAAVDIVKWFGVGELEGTIVFPGGERWDVRSPSGLPIQTSVSHPGPHLLETDDGTRVRVANFPRPKRDTTFSPDDWATRRPNTQVVWLSESDDALQDFDFIGEDPDKDKPGKYDLSPRVMPFIAAFLALELVGLIWYWRRSEQRETAGVAAPTKEPRDA